MRIWSLHPKHLDTKGLIGLWREALLARHVLEGKTKGYRHHPQLIRFRQTEYPVDRINQYLSDVYQEALKRKFKFDSKKVDWSFNTTRIPVTTGQVNFEREHLLTKLRKRDNNKYLELTACRKLELHPVFELVKGGIEEWEVLVL